MSFPSDFSRSLLQGQLSPGLLPMKRLVYGFVIAGAGLILFRDAATIAIDKIQPDASDVKQADARLFTPR